MGKSAGEEHAVKAFGWAARDQSGLLSPFKFSRRKKEGNQDEDVRFKVLYCGICHTELHRIKNDWGGCIYPLLPGSTKFMHEIVGVLTEVGSKVQKFKVGDKIGIGTLLGARHSCNSCASDLENYYSKKILTFYGTYHDGTTIYGGYSDHMVTNDHYVVRIPENLPLDAAAPLLCAGITTYSPLRYFELDKPGMHVGVVGLGGLGHVGVKFAKAFGAKVTVISTSPNKRKEAIEHLGADSFLDSRDPDQMRAVMGTMDGILDIVSVVHPLLSLIGLLKSQGKLIMLGGPDKPLELPVFPLLMGRKLVAGSACGGLKETQEMIDFAAKHNITVDIEVILMDYVNTAMERLAKGDVKYRLFVLAEEPYKSAIGDPGMRRDGLRVAIEAWNQCNEVGKEAPNMGSPRMADCFDVKLVHKVNEEDNRLGVSNALFKQSSIMNVNQYAPWKEIYLGKKLQVEDQPRPWQFWMTMLKSGNTDTQVVVCPENGKKTGPFSPQPRFPCFGQGCMNMPLIYHNYTTPQGEEGNNSLRGSFYGT
ncbi:unnamed protein product [Camellia sinensis]